MKSWRIMNAYINPSPVRQNVQSVCRFCKEIGLIPENRSSVHENRGVNSLKTSIFLIKCPLNAIYLRDPWVRKRGVNSLKCFLDSCFD